MTLISLFIFTSSTFAYRTEEFDGHDEQLLKRAKLFVDLVSKITASNGDDNNDILVEDIVADNFIREIRPDSLNLPDSNWDQYKSFLLRVSISLFETFDIIIDRSTVGSNRVILEAKPDAKLKESIGGGTYDQEYLLILEIDSNYRVTKLVEYVDSLYTACFFNLPGCPSVDSTPNISAQLSIVSSWPNGYCADVNIENTTDMVLRDWHVEVDVSSASINHVWKAIYTDENSNIVFTPPAWFTTLEPKSSFSFGYCADHDAHSNWQPSVIND